MCRMCHVLHRRRFGNRYVLQRIEKLDRHLKFFVKELAQVGHSSTAATQENASRAISLLLSAVMGNGTHQFCVEPGYGAARDFRNPRNVGIGGFGISAAQPYKDIAFLARFRRGKWFVEFSRDRGGNRAAAQRDAPQKNSS